MQTKLKMVVVCAIVLAGMGGLLFPKTKIVAAPTRIILPFEVHEVPNVTPILQRIAFCESQNQQYALDGSVLRGVDGHDYGRFQIRDIHFAEARSLGFDPMTYSGNTGYAKYLYEREGPRPWRSSEHCWKS